MVSILAIAGALAISSPAQADVIHGFTGPYDVSNWELINDFANDDGSVDTSNAPDSITIAGGNNGSGGFGVADFVITAFAAGTVRFAWSYQSADDPGFDWGAFLINGSPTVLSDTDGASGIGHFMVAVGDQFGFTVETSDNLAGRGFLTIHDFSAPGLPVPEPASAVLIGLGASCLGAARAWRQRTASRSHR